MLSGVPCLHRWKAPAGLGHSWVRSPTAEELLIEGGGRGSEAPQEDFCLLRGRASTTIQTPSSEVKPLPREVCKQKAFVLLPSLREMIFRILQAVWDRAVELWVPDSDWARRLRSKGGEWAPQPHSLWT